MNDNQVDLYKYTFPPDLSPGTLAVIGCIQPWGAINPISELQCRWACRVFKVREVMRRLDTNHVITDICFAAYVK